MAVSLPKTMKALIKEEEVPGYKFKELEMPEPQGDEVLIKVGYVLIYIFE